MILANNKINSFMSRMIAKKNIFLKYIPVISAIKKGKKIILSNMVFFFSIELASYKEIIILEQLPRKVKAKNIINSLEISPL